MGLSGTSGVRPIPKLPTALARTARPMTLRHFWVSPKGVRQVNLPGRTALRRRSLRRRFIQPPPQGANDISPLIFCQGLRLPVKACGLLTRQALHDKTAKTYVTYLLNFSGG